MLRNHPQFSQFAMDFNSKTPIECEGIKEYDDVIIFIGWLEFFTHNFKFSIEENLNLQRRRIIDRATRIYAYYIRIIDRYKSSRYSTDQVISPLLPFLYHECLSDIK